MAEESGMESKQPVENGLTPEQKEKANRIFRKASGLSPGREMKAEITRNVVLKSMKEEGIPDAREQGDSDKVGAIVRNLEKLKKGEENV